MKEMRKLLLLAILLIMLAGIAGAAEVSKDTTGTGNIQAVDNTRTVQHTAITEQYELEKNMQTDEKTNKDDYSDKGIEKNSANRQNPKKDSTITVSSWESLNETVTSLKDATANTTIILDKTSYKNTGTITWENHNNIVLTIDGNGQTIDGNQQQAFNITTGSSLILKNITITNSKAEIGGAISNYGTLMVTNSTLNNNIATYGGAICNYEGGSLTVTNSTLNNNIANYGGAIYNYEGCSLTVTNSTLNNNNAICGGVIENFGTLTVANSTLNNNNATYYGGAICNYGTLTVANSTLNNNNATYYGGAIHNSNGQSFDIVGCNFTQNHATSGAAIFSEGYLNATGNTFIENTADNKETIDLNGYLNGLFDDNHYYSTDISLSEIKISVKDNKKSFQYGENVELEFNLKPTNTDYYKDFSEGISDITLYINGEEKVIGKIEHTI